MFTNTSMIIGNKMSELYCSSQDTFFLKIQNFVSLADNEVLILSPYIKTEIVDSLIKKCPAKISIITTWKLRDIQMGISDIELYPYCKKKGIFLYIHPRIHLKAFVNDYTKCVFGSANISKKGFALVADHNYELDAITEFLDIDSVIYFKKILNESTLVNEEIYQKYQDAIKKLQPLPELEEPDITSIPKKSEFLISALPMSYDVNDLFEIYSHNFKHESQEKRECAIHDIILYNIPANLEYSKFRKLLKERFFTSKFIQKLLEFVTLEERYFGEVKEWIQRNCEDVPVPSKRDLTGNIQVLYKWIAELSDGEYKVDRPRYSERLFRVK
jgi:hypothetical protein